MCSLGHPNAKLQAVGPDYKKALTRLRQNRYFNKNNPYNLPTVYPDQNIFAITDVVSFYGLMGRYFLNKKDIFLASYYVNLIEELELLDDVPVDFITIFDINHAIVDLIKPLLENARQNEAKKQELIE